jgi:hypothetical protein
MTSIGLTLFASASPKNLSEANIVAPPEFALWQEAERVTLNRRRDALTHWLADDHSAGH